MRNGKSCSIKGCNEKSVRSISISRLSKIGMDVEGVKKAHLCSLHYKEFKKKSKDTRKVEQWRFKT